MTSVAALDDLDTARLDESQLHILGEATDDVQVSSKLWLLDEFESAGMPTGSRVLVVGGWCGILPWLAHSTGRDGGSQWISIDTDVDACQIGSNAVGERCPVDFVCQDAYEVDYSHIAELGPLTVVNTICEHLHDFARWRRLLPAGVTLVLQSNDYRGCADHVNCVDSAAELRQAADLATVAFEGSLDVTLFTRFMVIGET